MMFHKNINKTLIWGTLILVTNELFAQFNFPNYEDSADYKPKIEAKPSYKKAKKLISKENYIVALPYLEQVISKNATKGKDVSKELEELAVCYTLSKSAVKGLQILDSLEKSNSDVSQKFKYWKAVALHYNYRFDEAIPYYKASLKRTFLLKEEKEQIRRKIQECENGKLLINQNLEIEVVNVGSQVNTVFSEHSPTFGADSKTLYFTSRKNIDGQSATFTGEYYEDIYQTRLDSNFWDKPIGVRDLNSKQHDASSQLLNNNTTMVMYRSTHNGDIYISNFENNKWSSPKPINGLKSMSYESSAFMTKDGNRIYFSSNKFSDQGDLDLYYMDKNSNGQFSNPKSLGKHINTVYNEDGIYLTDDEQILYFSSQGHTSIGGYDVFKCTWDGSKWSAPVNVGMPINTPADDIFYSTAPNKKYSIFSSYREGGQGMRDLYLSIPTEKVQASLVFLDSLSGQKIDSSITVILNGKNFKKTETFDLGKGQYSGELKNHEFFEVQFIKAGITIAKDTFSVNKSVKQGLRFTKTFTIPYHKIMPIVKKDSSILDKLNIKENADTTIISKDFIFGNIYFEHNQSKIVKKYFKPLNELIKTMKENSEIVIEVQGYADEDGDVEYNKQLSDLRAHNVFDFIVSRGISRKRVLFKGYGQTNQFSNSKENTIKSDNRRVQFVIVK